MPDKPRVPSRPRIHVSNIFGDLNRGGAAITIATCRAAQRIGTVTTGTSIGAKGDDPRLTHAFTLATFPELRLSPSGLLPESGPAPGIRALLRSAVCLALPNSRWVPSGLRDVAGASLVISKGGFVFVERPSFGSMLGFWQTVFPLVYAHRLGIPTATSPTSVGPYRSWPSKLANGWVLRRISLVVTRDQYSYQWAKRIGVSDDSLCLLPDIAFSLPQPTVFEVQQARSRLSLGDETYACFVLRWDGATANSDVILDAQVRAAEALLISGLVHRIVVARQVLNSASEPEEIFMEALGAPCADTGNDWSPDELRALYAGAAVVVTARLHAAIFFCHPEHPQSQSLSMGPRPRAYTPPSEPLTHGSSRRKQWR